MKTTLELLQARYSSPAITADQLRADWLPQYSSHCALLNALRAGRLPGLTLTRIGTSARAPMVIYLTDLATWLDQHHNNPAAQAA